MELLNQPFNGQLGRRLIDLLTSTEYQHLTIFVAFARNSGVLRLKDAIAKFRARGGTVAAYVGVDLGGTSYEALTNLLRDVDSLSVVHSELEQTFHPKTYFFEGEKKRTLIVGSHNLTGGGLWTNFESSLLLSTDVDDGDGARIHADVSAYVAWLKSLGASFMPITDQADVERLLQNGYVVQEAIAKARRVAQRAQRVGQTPRLFGGGAHAVLPRIAAPAATSTAPTAAAPAVVPATPAPPVTPPLIAGQTIWFESRSMTGGSRNILDLSMTSLVERGDPTGTAFDRGDPALMRGATTFFGIDPADTGAHRLITLNFDGADYADNAILFPAGDKANGTWRLQIKGVDPSGEKITTAFSRKSTTPYLAQKVLVFSRVAGDYYYLSVFPQADLATFRAASRILARNGETMTARQIGLF